MHQQTNILSPNATTHGSNATSIRMFKQVGFVSDEKAKAAGVNVNFYFIFEEEMEASDWLSINLLNSCLDPSLSIHIHPTFIHFHITTKPLPRRGGNRTEPEKKDFAEASSLSPVGGGIYFNFARMPLSMVC